MYSTPEEHPSSVFPRPPTARLRPASISGRHTVMIVDDEPALLTVGKAILSTMELDIILARSGEEALIALGSPVVPDLIFLDLTMPGGMSGLEAFEQIHARYEDLPVIACSGFFGDGAEDVCRHIGFAGMLPKPYTAESLVSVVRRVLLCHSEY